MKASSADPSTQSLHLIGREREMKRISGFIAAIRTGVSGALCLVGEPGVGKSTVLEWVGEVATGARVLRTAGHETETDLAFAGLSQLLRGYHDLIDLLPAPQRDALNTALALGPPLRQDGVVIGSGLLTILELIAEGGPTLVIVDDAQWLDPATTSALAFACRRLDSEGVGVLIATREIVRDLKSFPLVDLSGIDLAATTDLITRSASYPTSPSVARHIWAETGGNPLALVEVAKMLTAEQLDGRHPLPDPLPIGVELQEIYQSRVRELPDATQQALLVLAAATNSLREQHLNMGDINPFEWDVLQPAEVAGLVSTSSDTASFRHPLMRAAVYHGAAPDARRATHELLASVETHPDLVAWHRAKSIVGRDREAADLLAEVAIRAEQRGAHLEAARAYLRCAELAAERSTAIRFRVAAAAAFQLAGDFESASAIIDDVAGQADATTRADIEHIRASLDLFRGDPRRLRDLLMSNARSLESQQPQAAARIYLETIIPCVAAGDSEAAVAPAERAAELLEEPHPLVELAMGVAKTEQGLEIEARPHLESAGHMLERINSVDQPMAVAFCALALGVHRRLDLAHKLIDDLVAEASARHMTAFLPFALTVSSILFYWSGSWGRSAVVSAESRELAVATGQAIGPSHIFSMFLLASRGQEVECQRAGELGADAIETGGDIALRCWHAAALGRLQLTVDRPSVAVAHLERALSLHPPGGVPDWTADLVEAYDRSGSRGNADEALLRLEDWAGTNNDPLGRVLVNHSKMRRAERSEIDDLYDQGLRDLALVRDPFIEARFALGYGERLRRYKRLTDARVPLIQAVDIFGSLRATPWTDRALGELRACGGAPPPRRADSLSSLTPQELRVASEVGAGATNREAANRLVLSEKTVAFHLGNVYRKLGVRSRTELARLMAESGRGPNGRRFGV